MELHQYEQGFYEQQEQKERERNQSHREQGAREERDRCLSVLRALAAGSEGVVQEKLLEALRLIERGF